MKKPSRTLTFKCTQCQKSVQVYLQVVSACSHIQPYQGICVCGTIRKHATGNQQAVSDYLSNNEITWSHQH